MYQKSIKQSALAFVSVFAMLVAMGCSQKSNQSANVLRLPLKDDVKTLDPVNAYDSVSLDVLPNIMETLLQYSYLNDQLVLEPLLAESMPEYSKDGLTVTVKIKKGVMFQDDGCFKATGGKGREVKAQDFIYAFKRHAIPALQSSGAWVFDGKVLGFSEFMKKLSEAKKEELSKLFEEEVAGFKALDDYTLQIKLTQAYPILNYILAMNFASPVAKEASEMYADADGNLRDHPVGTGPFMLSKWETNQRVVLVKNPNYKGVYPSSGSEKMKARGLLADSGKTLPMVDGVEFEIIKEDMPRFLRFEKGELDKIELTKDIFAAGMVDGSTVKPEIAAKGIVHDAEESLIMYYVQFNLKDKTLQNKYLRQAISSAVDRDKWIDFYVKNRGVRMTQVSPPGLLDRPEIKSIKYDYNLEKAKELLAKAGYPEGKGLPTLSFDFRGAETKYRQLGEFFVQQLGAVGIKVNVILNTFPAYLEKAKQGNLQIALGGWNFDYPDIENGYQLLYGPNKAPGPNDANWENAQYDALYKKLAAMPAGTKGRKEIAKQMEDLIQEETPWIYGYYEKTYNLFSGRLRNLRVAETIPNKPKYVRLENKEEKKK